MSNAVNSAKVEVRGAQKAAILLLKLGPVLSAEVLRHFDETRIERIASEVANVDSVASSIHEEVVSEAYELAVSTEYMLRGGEQYAREMLTQALGSDRAEELLERIKITKRGNSFDFLSEADPAQLANFLKEEHPQTIALILSHLKVPQTASILSYLEPDLQAGVAARIASMDRTSPEVLAEVERGLSRRISTVLTADYSQAGGVEYLVKVLNRVDRTNEKHILEALDSANRPLAEEVRSKMFVFENITMLDDKSVQRVLREVDMKDLAIALKGASAQVKTLILKNMSKRSAQTLQEEIEMMGPVRLQTVEESQGGIVNVIRRLEESEEIIIMRGDSGEFVV
ncbi:MAG: flagellar motor switch protein FliG [Chloroflexi bacterium]|nr:flagellar motor switch protein FliG [Chloroflexota bacterium]